MEIPLPVGNYMFKVNNRNPRLMCEICSKLTIKTPERRQRPHISHLVLVFLLLTLSREMLNWTGAITDFF